MRLKRLELHDFRNYDHFALNSIGGLTVLVGDNGVGKTNLLESIAYLTSGTSFRHPQISQVIRENRPFARIEGVLSDGNRELSVALALEAGKKRFTVNGKAKSAADVRGVLPSVTFTPDDLELAKKSSGVKRDAIDALGSQLARSYYIVKRDYEKTIRYKNRLFRDEAPQPLVESLNETLVNSAVQLFSFRVALFDRLVPKIARNYDAIAQGNGSLRARYVPSWSRLSADERPLESGQIPSRDELRDIVHAQLARHGLEERRRSRALIGPHADAIGFELDGRDVATFASQGQQRSVVLAWKLAEVELTREILGVTPVLLLDDVMSELDARRREMLVSFVSDEVQTFITTTDLANFSPALLAASTTLTLGQAM